jgi:DNA-directed RNA polymerase specialized sigma24 family protein
MPAKPAKPGVNDRRILDLRADGIAVSVIAERLGVSVRTVHGALQRQLERHARRLDNKNHRPGA